MFDAAYFDTIFNGELGDTLDIQKTIEVEIDIAMRLTS